MNAEELRTKAAQAANANDYQGWLRWELKRVKAEIKDRKEYAQHLRSQIRPSE